MTRYHPDTFAVAADVDVDYRGITEFAIAPSGRVLFVFALVWMDDCPSDLLALDPSTLAVRFVVSGQVADGPLGGDGTFDGYGGHLNGLAVCGDEVFVGCYEERSIRVLCAATGQLLRVMQGGWGVPVALCCVADRLYLLDAKPEAPAEEKPGRRILVLTPKGDTLSVCDAPPSEMGPAAEGAIEAARAELAADDPDDDTTLTVVSRWRSVCHFDGKLIVGEENTIDASPLGRVEEGALLAFEGL